MKRVHCDGCGCTEPQGSSKNNKIRTIKLSIVQDPRWPEGSDNYEADLCPNCQGIMLHQYFKVPAEGRLELPAFIGPRRESRDNASEESKTASLGLR